MPTLHAPFPFGGHCTGCRRQRPGAANRLQPISFARGLSCSNTQCIGPLLQSCGRYAPAGACPVIASWFLSAEIREKIHSEATATHPLWSPTVLARYAMRRTLMGNCGRYAPAVLCPGVAEGTLCVAAPTARRDAPGRGILDVAETAPAALWLTEVLARAGVPEPARLAREAAQEGDAQSCEPPIRPGRRPRPARERLASLMVNQDRRSARPRPAEDHRLVRDPSMGWHVPVSNLGFVVRLTVPRWW